MEDASLRNSYNYTNFSNAEYLKYNDSVNATVYYKIGGWRIVELEEEPSRYYSVSSHW